MLCPVAQTLADLGQQNDPKVVEQLVAQHNAEILALWERLMGYEMLLVDQLEEVVKDFERNYSDLVGAFVEQVQAFMAQVRELEAAHHERLLDMSSTTLEKVLKNELEEELPDDLRLVRPALYSYCTALLYSSTYALEATCHVSSGSCVLSYCTCATAPLCAAVRRQGHDHERSGRLARPAPAEDRLA